MLLQKVFQISEDITKAYTLPGEFYSSERMFEQVKEQLFMRSWQIACRSEDVAIPMSAYPFDLMPGLLDEPLVITRDNNDELHCMSNVCTHRGNILIESAGPLSGNNIRCRYHGRKFNVDGSFLQMPECEGMQGFPSESDSLTNVSMREWKGFIFASLDPVIPFDQMVKGMDERVGFMPIEQFTFDAQRSREYLVNANWALYCDNYLEGFHIPFVHKDLSQTLDYSQYRSILDEYSNLQLGVGKSGETCFDLPDGHPDHGQDIAAFYYWVFPNLMFNFYPWGLSVNVVRPLSVNKTKVSFLSYVWDESKLEDGAGSLLDRVEREDEHIVELVHKGTASRLYDRGRYSPKMEKGVHHFHRLIARFLDQ